MSQFVEKRVGEVLGRAEKQPTPGVQREPGSERKDADVKVTPDRIFTF
jgi:hypothetical protein